MDKVDRIVSLLKKEIGESTAVVWAENPFVVLIGTVLSQRTKGQNTAKASETLFAKYRAPEQVANINLKNLEQLIKPSGFYKIKAKRIKEISKILVENFGGEVPENFEDLISLPGVGRKTANCVLVYGFGIPAIPVDVHVHRLSNRLGLVKTNTPEQTEAELVKILPKKYWLDINELMVKYGQRKCLPRNPKCKICKIREYCEYGKSIPL